MMTETERVAAIRTLVSEIQMSMVRMAEIVRELNNLDCEAWLQYDPKPDGLHGDMTFGYAIRNPGDLDAKKVSLPPIGEADETGDPANSEAWKGIEALIQSSGAKGR